MIKILFWWNVDRNKNPGSVLSLNCIKLTGKVTQSGWSGHHYHLRLTCPGYWLKLQVQENIYHFKAGIYKGQVATSKKKDAFILSSSYFLTTCRIFFVNMLVSNIFYNKPVEENIYGGFILGWFALNKFYRFQAISPLPLASRVLLVHQCWLGRFDFINHSTAWSGVLYTKCNLK